MKQKLISVVEYKPLIYNSDIAELKKKMEVQNLNQLELELLWHDGWLETKVQSAFKNIIETLNREIQYKKLGKIEFRQNDNGAALSPAGKMRKHREGTVTGMLDATIYVWSERKKSNKTWLVEVKRVGSPAQIKISKEQLGQIELFKNMNYPAYLTNNTVYFKEVVCKEIMEFVELRKDQNDI